MYVNLLFWFQFFCGFSGSTMSNSWVLIFFNLLFTSVPPLLFGVLDKNVSADTLLSLPQLYKAGQNSQVGMCTLVAILCDLLPLHFLKCLCANMCNIAMRFSLLAGLPPFHFLAEHAGCFLPEFGLLLCSILCESIMRSIFAYIHGPLPCIC